MVRHEFDALGPRQHAEQVLAQSQEVLRTAVSIVLPEHPDADPLIVFPPPNEIRAEDEGLPLSKEQTQQLVQNAAELGFGRSEDVTLSEQGLIGATVVIEGGQPHKMMAESLVVMNDEDAMPDTIILTASGERQIDNPAEIKSAESLFGRARKTEYEVAKDVVRSLPGFTELGGPEAILNFSYDINNGFEIGNEANGQFVMFGYVRGGRTPIILMRVDRENYQDKAGVNKYRNQPQTADIIGIIDAYRKSRSRYSSEPIVLVTSGTYRPSRAVSMARAGLSIDRVVGLATYGNDLVNLVRSTDSPPPVNQLPGELYKMALEVVRLDEALAAQQR